MDYHQVIERAVELGCRVENRGGRHKSLVLPKGGRVTISTTPSDTNGGLRLITKLRAHGVDIRRHRDQQRGQDHGPVKRINADTLYCKQDRCANLVCRRNTLAIDPENKPADVQLTTFQSSACGYMPIKGCTKVDWVTDPKIGRLPRLCALGDHEGECAFEKPQVPAKRVPQTSTKGVTPEKWEEMFALVRGGESQVSVARAYGVPQSELSRKLREADGVLGRRTRGLRSSKYPVELRKEAVRRVLAGELAKDVAAALGVSDGRVVGSWVHEPLLGGDPNYDGNKWKGEPYTPAHALPHESPATNGAAPTTVPPVETTRVAVPVELPPPPPPVYVPRAVPMRLKFCVYCGTSIEAMPAGIRFCPQCGHAMPGVQ